jgi:hypothetical protein
MWAEERVCETPFPNSVPEVRSSFPLCTNHPFSHSVLPAGLLHVEQTHLFSGESALRLINVTEYKRS